MHSGSDSHYAEELLEKYAVGQLSDGQTALIEEHLLICFECQVRLSGIDEYVHATKAATVELAQLAAARKPPLSELVFHRLGRGVFGIPVPVWAGGLALLAVSLLIPHRPESAAQSEIALSALRGGNTGFSAHAQARNKILLRIDANTLPVSPSYGVELVDASGRQVWRGVLSAHNREILAPIPERLKAGRYWVRVSSASDEKLLQEYGVSVD